MITRNGHIKLSDFGLSKSLESKNFPDFKAELVERNTKPAAENDRLSKPLSAPRRTQQEQLLHWQQNRRTLVWTLFSDHYLTVDTVLFPWSSSEVFDKERFFSNLIWSKKGIFSQLLKLYNTFICLQNYILCLNQLGSVISYMYDLPL